MTLPLVSSNSGIPMTMTFGHVSHVRDNIMKHRSVQSWDELAILFARPEYRSTKDGPLISPGVYAQDGTTGLPDDPGRRANENVATVGFLALDLDHRPLEDLISVIEAFDGLELIVYPTWSYIEHARAGLGAWRVFVQLSRPVAVAEWHGFWDRIEWHCAHGKIDRKPRHPAAIFYYPAAPESIVGTPDETLVLEQFARQRGEPLDVDAVLGLELPDAREAMKIRPKITLEDAAGYVASGAERKQAEEWLRTTADQLSMLPVHEAVYGPLNRAAFLAGSRIPHLLTPEKVLASFMSAMYARRPTTLDEICPRHACTFRAKYENWTTIGIQDGMRHPWLPSRRVSLNQFGLARRFVEDHGADFRHEPTWKKWFVWTGRYWMLDAAGVWTRRRISQTLESIKREIEELSADPEEAEYCKLARQLIKAHLSAWGLAGILSCAETFEGTTIRYSDFDTDPYLLNVGNGTIDLRSMELKDHDPRDLLTRLIPTDHVPTARAPKWEKFIGQIFHGDPAVVDYIQRAVGYSLTASTQEHCLFFLHGGGRNGKTTFVNTILELMGGAVSSHSYATRMRPELVQKGRDEHPTETTNLFGARFVAVPELNEQAPFAESTIKALTGGEIVKARRMREDYWQFAPTHKMWLSANDKPRVRGTDSAIWSRIRLIPFEVSFAGKENRTLDRELRTELAGILAWAMRGCVDWQRMGLCEPESVKVATEQYKQEEDSTLQFLDDKIEMTTEEHRITRAAMRRMYEQWCIENGERYPLSHKGFSAALRKKGVLDKKHGPDRVWGGVRVRDAATQPSLRAITGGRLS